MKQSLQSWSRSQHLTMDAAYQRSGETRRCFWQGLLLTRSSGYRFAIRSFSGDTSIGSVQEESVEVVEQSGRIMSEPTQS